MRSGPPPPEWTLPVLSGALLALAYPPARLLLPAFVGLVPLLVFIADRPDGPAGRWQATRAAGITGLVYFGLQLYWLAVALVRHSALAIPAYALTVALLAGLAAAFGWAVHLSIERIRLPLPVAAAIFWTALEWLQGHLGDIAFPWLGLGTALAPFPRIAGAADLVGARGLTFWLAAVNGLVAAALLRQRAGRPVRALVGGIAIVVALPVAYGVLRAATLDLRPAARVAVVQPNIPEEVKLDAAIAVDSSLRALESLTARIRAGAVDLVVWPEVALPAVLGAAGDVDGLAGRVRAMSRAADAPILAGAYGPAAGEDAAYNSAFMVSAVGGAGGARYDKRRLVPFLERVPFIDPALLARLGRDPGYYGGLARGGEGSLLTVPVRGEAQGAGVSFGVLICYESIFARLPRRYRAGGADFLVNITNDAWYGREPWYERTTALWQHPAHLTMRAIETRIGIARSANTGFSMFIDPLGRTHQRTQLFRPDVRIGEVMTTDVVTLFVRWGDWLATAATLAAALALLAAAMAGADRTPTAREPASAVGGTVESAPEDARS